MKCLKHLNITGREVSEMNSQSPGFLALLILQKFCFYVPHFLLKGREHFSNIPIRIIGWHVQFLIYWPITVFLQETTLTQTRADHWKGRVRSSCFIWNEKIHVFPWCILLWGDFILLILTLPCFLGWVSILFQKIQLSTLNTLQCL